MEGAKKQLNVRIPQSLHDKIELKGEGKQEIVIAALELYFASTSEQKANNPSSKDDSKLIESLECEVKDLSNKLDHALQLVSQEQSINMTMQKQLMPSQEESTKKNWWQFWKKG